MKKILTCLAGLMDTKVREINNKRHRETPKNKYRILDVNKNSKQIGYKQTLERVVESIERALEKVEIEDDIIVYKAVPEGKLRLNNINLFDLNPKTELQRAFSEFNSKISLYKISLKKGTKAIGFTNSIFYDNQYKTLPVGMNLDTRILVNTEKLEMEEIDRDAFKMIKFDDEKNDFTGVTIRSVSVINCEQKEDEEN